MKTINDIKSGKFAGLKSVATGHLVVTYTPASVSSSKLHAVAVYNRRTRARRTTHKTAYGARMAFAYCLGLCK